jgi:hypothetical protein
MKHHLNIETRKQKLLSLVKEAKESVEIPFPHKPARQKDTEWKRINPRFSPLKESLECEWC